jgi:hypothetical protein
MSETAQINAVLTAGNEKQGDYDAGNQKEDDSIQNNLLPFIA